jgi:hypothetical protein
MSLSSKGQAAWERARQYAAEHGVNVREARSLLAQESHSEPDSSEPLPCKGGGGKSDPINLAAAEEALRHKYPHIVPGTLTVYTSGLHQGRRTVEIACQTPGCEQRRIIHTSDAFQVKYCLDCTAKNRSDKRSS